MDQNGDGIIDSTEWTLAAPPRMVVTEARPAKGTPNLVLTDTGRLVLDYADTIFRTGDELLTVLDRDGKRATHVEQGSSRSRLRMDYQANGSEPDSQG